MSVYFYFVKNPEKLFSPQEVFMIEMAEDINEQSSDTLEVPEIELIIKVS